jgi:hypothetical protein
MGRFGELYERIMNAKTKEELSNLLDCIDADCGAGEISKLQRLTLVHVLTSKDLKGLRE